jgi:hypothetical protein
LLGKLLIDHLLRLGLCAASHGTPPVWWLVIGDW